MHILITLAGLLAGAAFRYYRLKMVREVGSEVVDAVGRPQSKYRRNKIRTANAESPIAAVVNPVTACSTLRYTLLANPKTRFNNPLAQLQEH